MSLLERRPVNRSLFRDRLIHGLAIPLLVVLTACLDDGLLLHPIAPAQAGLTVAYHRTAAARQVAAADQARIAVTRAGALVHESLHDLPAGQEEVRIQIAVEIESATEALDVLVELLEDGRVLARRTQSVTLQQGQVTSAVVTPDPVADNITMGDAHGCMLAADGAAYCWGASQGRLGTVSSFASTRPTPVAGGLRFVSITAGIYHTCALTEAGQAYCWGDNRWGQLGDGSTTSRPMPVTAAGALRFVQIAAGADHTCGLAAAGEVRCWGDNRRGQLGNAGIGQTSTTPVMVSGGHTFDSIDSALWENCGTSSGEVLCWGSAYFDLQNLRHAPVVVTTPEAARSVAVGTLHDCLVAVTSTAYCWGGVNDFGMIGKGSASVSQAPTLVTGDHSFAVIETPTSNSFLAAHSCGIDFAGGLFCWGLNDMGQLGTAAPNTCDARPGYQPSPTVECSFQPIPVGGPRFSAIALGGQTTCGLAQSGEAYCWGDNRNGLLGTGDVENRPVPTRVAAPGPVPVLERIELTPFSVTMAAGDSANITGTGRDQTGALLLPVFDWSISDTMVVSLNSPAWPSPFRGPRRSVRVWAKASGSAVLRASAEGKTAAMTVVVN